MTSREWERWELASERRKVEERDELWQWLLQYGYYDTASEAQAEALCAREVRAKSGSPFALWRAAEKAVEAAEEALRNALLESKGEP